MKKIYFFATMLMATMALLTTSCETHEEPPIPEPTELTFEVEFTNVTKSSVTYTVTPSVNDADYLVVLVDEAYIDNVGVGEALISEMMTALRSQAATSGKTFDAYMSEVVNRGEDTNTFSGLAHNTDYSLVIFGVDGAADWAATTEPLCSPFTTEDVEMSTCTFEITPEVDGTSVAVKVAPSDKNMRHHLFIIPEEHYVAYTDPAGEYKFTDDSLFAAYFQSELSAFETLEQAINGLTIVGDATYSAASLNANTTYAYMIAGLLLEDDMLYIVTDATKGSFTTGDVAASELTFNIEVSNVEMNKADIKITPSNDTETFTWVCGTYDGVSTEEELMNNWISQNQMWFDMGFMLYSGVQDYTAAGPNYKYSVSLPDTDYYVLAVGYAGGITTAPEVEYFRTLPAPDPADATFTMSYTVTPYSAEIAVDSSDETSYYTFGVVEKGTFDEAALIEEAEMGVEQMVQMNQMFNPGSTAVDVLSMYYWNGDGENVMYELTPNTAYTAYVLVFNNDGTVAKCHAVEDAFTTHSVGSVTPEIELLGYYSGDEENGAVFGQPDATAGKVIAVAHYTNADEMTSLYATAVDPYYINTYEGTELFGYLWPTLKYNPISVDTPYSFIVLEWSYEACVVAISADASGVLGEIVASEIFTPVPEGKGDIEELKALVNELNSKDEPEAVSPKRSCIAPAKERNTNNRFVYKADPNEPMDFVPENLKRPEAEEVTKSAQDKYTLRPLGEPTFVRVR